VNAGRLIRTLRHLRPPQVGWRFVHEARLRVDRVRPERRDWVDGQATFALGPSPRPTEADEKLREEALLWRNGRVRHLAIEGDRADFAGVGKPKLWRYEFQYQRELVAVAHLAEVEGDSGMLEEAKDFVSAWALACPQPRGDAWEPYPVARRILNWSLAAWISPGLRTFLAPGIAAQARFLAGRLERHLLGNHLICDAAALVVASAAVDGSGLSAIGESSLRLLTAEVQRQTLPDGGYGERTAQYHAIVLRDVLLALAFRRARGLGLDPHLAECARAMARCLANVARGEAVPYLNDAAPDAAPPVSEVLSLARALRLIEGPWRSWLGAAFGPLPEEKPLPPRGDLQLPQTGWTLIREGAHELLFEHGAIGPDEQPGHGHSDALSFELIWDGRPIVLDTGVTTYDIGEVRAFERSAAAHAAVTVDGQGPDELWASFRVGSRGQVLGEPVRRSAEGTRTVAGSVSSKRFRHRRRLDFRPGAALVVVDEVTPIGGVIRSHLPLAPGCTIEAGILAGTLRLQVLRGTLGPAQESWVGQGFGVRIPRKTYGFEADDKGRVVYAICAPGWSIELEGRSYVLRGPGTREELGPA
jgi:hypothetical protein